MARLLDAVLDAVRSALRVTGMTETASAEQALAAVREDLLAARQEKAAEQAALNQLMAEALDGGVDAGSLQSQHSALRKIDSRIEQIESLERAVIERVGRANANEVARERVVRWNAFHRHHAEMGKAAKDLVVSTQRLCAAIVKLQAESTAAKAAIPDEPERWPRLLDLPNALCNSVCLELVRLDHRTFRFYGYSMAMSNPTLEEQLKRALAELLPDSPEKEVA